MTWIEFSSLSVDFSRPTMAEWALMVMLIALACLTGVSLLGTNLRDFYNSVAGMI